MSENDIEVLPRKIIRHLGMYRFSMPWLLVSLVLLLAATPFLEMLKSGKHIESICLTLVLISAVQAVGNRRRDLILAVALMSPALVGKWLNHLWPDSVPPQLFLVSILIFILFIIVQLLRFILLAPRVTTEVLCAGISTYLMLGLLWSFGYELVARSVPGAFVFNGPDSTHVMAGFTSLYFSFVTLSTVGYGDITPVNNVARMLAALEAVTGSLFIGVLIARLVSLYSSQPAVAPDKETGDNK